MPYPDYPLTTEMFAALLRVGRVENADMASAMHDVLVLQKKVSPTAKLYGFKRQQLHVRVHHLLDVIKPAFDEYAALVVAHL